MIICENGGTYSGTTCLCPSSFYGPLCEFSTDSFTTNLPYPGTIVASLVANVTVTNFNYTAELNDTQSDAYRLFEKHFRSEIKKVYGTIPGYEGVEIISLSPGSIVVEHEIFFTIMETDNVTETFEETTRMVVQRLQETQATQGDCQHDTCG
ncbi:hypothetical protein AV530_008862 [Patagioenas fasciata monilis]|uniref:SEA domain-containing protein n=1 Tax=Patagioenas fasciata monilis TaxID=372326 RepID=A0A1V4KZV8_PATFA|nr:hypothetical protein AV530_008862 [Patagioenas fasciata monilis]